VVIHAKGNNRLTHLLREHQGQHVAADDGHASSVSLHTVRLSIRRLSNSQTAGGVAPVTRKLPFEVHYDAACCWGRKMYCSTHDAWRSLAMPTSIILRSGRRHRHPSERKWLITGDVICTVSAKLLITEASHGAGTKRVCAYSRIVHIWLVLISEVDCH